MKSSLRNVARDTPRSKNNAFAGEEPTVEAEKHEHDAMLKRQR